MEHEISDDDLQDSPFAWWEWDVDANRVRYNDLKTRYLGFGPGEFQENGYQSFTELLHPQDWDKSMEAMKAVLRGDKEVYQVDYRIRARDGSYRWFMDRGLVTRRDGGRPRTIRGIVIDLGLESTFTGSPESVVRIVHNSLRLYNGSLESVLTVCSVCKKVKHEAGDYVDLSPQLRRFLGTRLSHGLCPRCLSVLLPGYDKPGAK